MSATIDNRAAQASVSLPAEQAENLYKKVFWRFVPFIMLCYVVAYLEDRKSTRLNSSHKTVSRMPSSA